MITPFSDPAVTNLRKNLAGNSMILAASSSVIQVLCCLFAMIKSNNVFIVKIDRFTIYLDKMDADNRSGYY